MTPKPLDISRMRRADDALGRPLCAALTLARRVGLVRDEPDAPPRRLLIIKLAEQGATVVAAPALRRAVELVGRDDLFVAVFEQNRPILDQLEIVAPDHVLTVKTTSARRTLLDLWRVARRARRLGIDTTVDFESFARSSAVLAVLSGARRRVGLHAYHGAGPGRGDLLTHRLNANPLQHASHTFLALVEAAAEPTHHLPALDHGPWPLEAPAPVPLGSVELADARALVDELVGTSGPLVLLNPNAGDLVPLRRWPEERYVELAQRLLAARPDLRVLVTGAPDEAEAAQHVAARVGSDRCASAAGRTTLRGLLALYHQAEVLVTNDSGPAHYATLTPIEVVALFGPESPEVFGPVGRRAHALSARLVCSPCVNAFNDRRSPCADNLCMQRIEVDEVLATIEDLLRRRWPASP